MKSNDNKQILVSIGILLAFFGILGIGIFAVDSFKAKGNTSSDDTTSMHAPPPAADSKTFQSLLNLPAPEFKLTSYDGREVSLGDFKGKNVVLFFSEGAMCAPSCWDQINAFTNDKEEFADKNAVILTVVVDPKSDWDGVIKEDSNIASATVLLDSDKEVSKKYGVLTVGSSMHRGQFPGHTYVVIDKEGIVRYELDDVKMGINNSQLLAQVGKL